MYTVYIATLIGGVLAYIARKHKAELSLAIMLWVAIVLTGLFVATVMGSPPQIVYEERSVTPLAAVSDGLTIDGKFFLGTGSINNEMYYHYYYSTGTGIAYNRVRASSTEIRYCDSAPRLVELRRKISQEQPSGWRGFVIPSIPTPYRDTKYIMYVPHGNIWYEFDLNLGKRGTR